MSKSLTTSEKKRKMAVFIAKRDGAGCYYCGDRMTEYHGPKQRTLDHILPKSRGGLNATWNLRLACRRCNEKRKNGPTVEKGGYR